jgi:excisionase family DNA binding protein
MHRRSQWCVIRMTQGGPDPVETLLVNDAEASRLLAISRSKFHLLVAQGRIPRIKIGRSARYRWTDLLAYTEELASEAAENTDSSAVGAPPRAAGTRW